MTMERVNKKGIFSTAMGRRTMMISAPPSMVGRSGPPSDSQYLSALSVTQSLTDCLSFWEMRKLRSLTPCKVLWNFLVISKTPGLGLGTERVNGIYIISHRRYNDEMRLILRSMGHLPYQVRSTPNKWANRSRACRIRATPPPWGVLLKNAILVLLERSLSA